MLVTSVLKGVITTVYMNNRLPSTSPVPGYAAKQAEAKKFYADIAFATYASL